MAIFPYYQVNQPFDWQQLTQIQRTLGVNFQKPKLLITALTHSSYLNENHDYDGEDNERLEFLGDAVIGLAVAEDLCGEDDSSPYPYPYPYHYYKNENEDDDEELSEGEMTLIRQRVVNGKTLARVARSLDLGDYLLMGRGEERSGGRNRNSNLAGAFEAVVGAIFSDKGYPEARTFCLRVLDDAIDDAYDQVTAPPKQTAKAKPDKKPLNTGGKHPKAALQELVQAKYRVLPQYRVTDKRGKSNAMTFTVEVCVNGRILGKGSGKGKKAAETAAALKALAKLK